MPKLMQVGSRVRTATDLPGIPAGSEGVVGELGRVFVAVQFADGRTGYYARRQLVVVPDPADRLSDQRTPDADLGIAGAHLPYGSHLCFLPGADEHPLQTPALYLRAGLAAGDVSVAIGPGEWRGRLVSSLRSLGRDTDHAQASRDLVIMDIWDYYYPPSEFTADRQIERLREALRRAAPLGRGLRLLGHAAACMMGVDPDEWCDYELRATPILGEAKTLALCSYAELPEDSPLRKAALTTHKHLLSGGQVHAL